MCSCIKQSRLVEPSSFFTQFFFSFSFLVIYFDNMYIFMCRGVVLEQDIKTCGISTYASPRAAIREISVSTVELLLFACLFWQSGIRNEVIRSLSLILPAASPEKTYTAYRKDFYRVHYKYVQKYAPREAPNIAWYCRNSIWYTRPYSGYIGLILQWADSEPGKKNLLQFSLKSLKYLTAY